MTRHTSNRNAFTLIELLISIAVIGILISILVPALGHARQATIFTGELSTARQFLVAHSMYSNDNKQLVMPGYASQSMVTNFEIKARFLDGTLLNGTQSWQDIARYPWRLLPYFEFDTAAMFRDFDATTELFGGDPASLVHQTAIAPRLGLNQVFVGGSADTDGTGFAHIDNPNNASVIRAAWGDQWYLKRSTQARNPTKLIVFAAAEQPDTLNTQLTVDGYYKVLPPYFRERRWAEEQPGPETRPSDVGFLSFTYVNKAAVSMLDGHAEGISWLEAQDMSRWAPLADTPDYTLPPP